MASGLSRSGFTTAKEYVHRSPVAVAVRSGGLREQVGRQERVRAQLGAGAQGGDLRAGHRDLEGRAQDDNFADATAHHGCLAAVGDGTAGEPLWAATRWS